MSTRIKLYARWAIAPPCVSVTSDFMAEKLIS